MYDQDNSGAISPEEMVEIFTLMYSVQGSSEEDAVEQARKVFAALDVDKDGKIGLEEFITGCMENSEALGMFGSSS